MAEERDTRIESAKMGRLDYGVTERIDLLAIAKLVEEFVNFNHWSWCTMEQVYKILKVVHQ